MYQKQAIWEGDLPYMGNIFCNAGQTLTGGESLVNSYQASELLCCMLSSKVFGEVEVEMAWIYLGKKQRVDHSLMPLARTLVKTSVEI